MGCGASASIHAQLVVQPSLRHPLPRFPPSLINSLLVNPGGPFRIVNITGMAQVKEIVENKNVPDDGKNTFKTLFCKENVFVHPSGSRDEGIPGYLSLIELDDGNTAFAWTPYYMLRGDESAFVNVQSTEKSLLESTFATVPLPSCTTDLYAVRVPLSEIQSFRKMSSTIGTPNIIVVLQGGIALPPYYFHAGGVREFLSCVEDYATLIKSPDDTNLFFVHDLSYPLAQSLSHEKQLQKQELQATTDNSNNTQQNTDVQPVLPVVKEQSSGPAGKDISWSILENFAKITRFARMAEKTLFADGTRSPPPPPSAIPRGPRSDLAQQSTLSTSPPLHHSTAVGSFEVLGGSLDEAPKAAPSSPQVSSRRGEPLSQEEWISCFDSEGRISAETEVELRKRIFYGGIEPMLRQEVWKYLLGYLTFNSTFVEREKIQMDKQLEYNKIKSQWTTIDQEQESHFSKFRSRRHRIEKDVVRTDRTHPFYAQEGGPGLQQLQNILVTYSFFNFDLGYVQGMSDLLAPILVNMQDEVAAYWCFKKLMDRMGNNFHKDQNGMHTQLVQLNNLLRCMDPELHEYLRARSCTNMFFCFRWVLIQFKREFPFDTVMTLWEMLWSNYCGKNYHMFLCVAILMKKRSDIINNQMEFDDILKHLNNLSMQMNLQEYLVYAELLYTTFVKKVDPQFAELRDFIMSN